MRKIFNNKMMWFMALLLTVAMTGCGGGHDNGGGGAAAGPGPAGSAPALGAASTFGFLSSAALTNEGNATVITGDAGTTAASGSIVAFHDSVPLRSYRETCPAGNCGSVTGQLFATSTTAGDPAPGLAATVNAAAADALNAFSGPGGLSPARRPGGLAVETCVGCGGGDAGELGGRTLAPGVYLSTPGTYGIGELAHPATFAGERDLTLDAKGNANAVWVFQAPGGLTVGLTGPAAPAFPISVKLINKAQAKNVFWYVPAGATIGTGSTMVGTMISTAAITFSTTGAAAAALTTLDGRALVLTAGATMVNTVVNVPAP